MEAAVIEHADDRQGGRAQRSLRGGLRVESSGDRRGRAEGEHGVVLSTVGGSVRQMFPAFVEEPPASAPANVQGTANASM